MEEEEEAAVGEEVVAVGAVVAGVAAHLVIMGMAELIMAIVLVDSKGPKVEKFKWFRYFHCSCN